MRADPLKKADIVDATLGRLMPEAEDLRGQVWLPEEYEEVRLFALLLWRFGRPNGGLSLIVSPRGDPDAPFKWDFSFELTGVHLNPIRSAWGLEIQWWGRQMDEATVLEFFRNNLALHEADVDETIDSLEKYSLLINPYARHKTMAELAQEELLQTDPVAPPSVPMVGATQEMYRSYMDAVQDYYRMIDREAMYSMVLVAESAFMAEAYLNLLYAGLMRPVVRASKDLRDEALMRQWKKKVQHLPSDCDHVVKTPDLGDSRVRDATWLFRLRNRIAHSYPDESEMRVGGMWFFKSFPVFPTASSVLTLLRNMNNQLPSRQDAVRALTVAHGFVEYLNELLDPRITEELTEMAGAQPMGFNETKGIYGVPFSRYTALPTFPSKDDAADHADDQAPPPLRD